MFSGLSIATSGIRVAHTQLGVVGHNMSNAEIRGYSRQRIVQRTAMTMDKGMSATGNRMRVEMGADRNAVQQLRNEFLDFTYREHTGRLHFYNSLVTTGREIENMLGELHGAYSFQSVVNDMWYAIQELTRHPDGFATRQFMISTAQSFLNKAREVYLGLVEEQHNLNHQIIQTVNDINHWVSEINRLNGDIRNAEMAGDNANDYRDERNLAIDNLSELLPIEVRINAQGDVNILSMGHELLAHGQHTLMGFRYISADYDFVIPVLGTDGQTISADTPPDQFVNFMHLRPINYTNGNDGGRLMALMLARGMAPANYMSHEVAEPGTPGGIPPTPPPATATKAQIDEFNARVFNHQLHEWSIHNGMIPRVQIHLDTIVNGMVRLMNDALTGQLREVNPNFNSDDPNNSIAPGDPFYVELEGGRYRYVHREETDPPSDFGAPLKPWNLNGEQVSTPMFVRKYGNVGGPIDPNDINSLYSIENLKINEALLEAGGHNLMALSLGHDEINDTRILEALQTLWRSQESPYTVEIGGHQHRIQDAYIRMVNQIATDVNEAIRFVEAQRIQVIQADNSRQAIKGVSMDEELADMLRFQYAFQSASRVVNLIDSMIETVINLGRR